MAYPRWNVPFHLIVDAATGGAESTGGMGAILGQMSAKNQFQVVAYASRSLKDHEKNYTPYVAEMCAAAWAIHYFDIYLRGRKFTVYTDHKPLETLKTVHQRTLNRLQEQMGMYDFELVYKKGSEMPADILSRCPIDAIEAVSLQDASLSDPFCMELREYMATGNLPPMSLFSAHVIKAAPYAADNNGILTLSHDALQVVVLPLLLAPSVIAEAHGTLLTGHGSTDKTLRRVRTQYFWPSMTKDVEDFIRQCPRCQRVLGKATFLGPLHPLPLCTATNQRVHCDLFGPLKTIGSKGHVLCITDAHTKFVELVALPCKDAKVVADAIFRAWVCRFGIPDQLFTDGGKEFCNSVMATLCDFLGIEKGKTTPAHPQCNAQAEVVNKTIKKYLAAMTENSLEWEDLLPSLAFSYNTSFHKTIGMAPAQLMLGYLPRALITKALPTYSEEPIFDTLRYFQKARALANTEALRKTEQYRQYHDARIKQTRKFHVGQFVLLDRRVFVGENAKLADRWEGPFIIQKILRNGVIDILRKGRTLRVNVQRVKPHFAMADIKPAFTVPDPKSDKLDDLSGQLDNTSEPDPPDMEGRPEDLEILLKEPDPDKFPISHQDTPFGRHPMVLRKRSREKLEISEVLPQPTLISSINERLIEAYARLVNLQANHILINELDLPIQVSTFTTRRRFRRRWEYLQNLPPAKRNSLLTGDPEFQFDPIAYEYVWSSERPRLDEDIKPIFGHLPGVMEHEHEGPGDDHSSVKSEEFYDTHPIKEELPMMEDEPPQEPGEPMVEDSTFYDIQTPRRSRSSPSPSAPRHNAEYTKPLRKNPWYLPAERWDGRPRTTAPFEIGWEGPPRNPPTTPGENPPWVSSHSSTPPTFSSPRVAGSSIKKPVIGPQRLEVFSPQQGIYRPTTVLGRQSTPLRPGMGSTGVSARTAPPEMWSPQTTRMPLSSLPVVYYPVASPTPVSIAPSGSTDTRRFALSYSQGDTEPSSEPRSSTGANSMSIGINTLDSHTRQTQDVASRISCRHSTMQSEARDTASQSSMPSSYATCLGSPQTNTSAGDTESTRTANMFPIQSTSEWIPPGNCYVPIQMAQLPFQAIPFHVAQPPPQTTLPPPPIVQEPPKTKWPASEVTTMTLTSSMTLSVMFWKNNQRFMMPVRWDPNEFLPTPTTGLPVLVQAGPVTTMTRSPGSTPSPPRSRRSKFRTSTPRGSSTSWTTPARRQHSSPSPPRVSFRHQDPPTRVSMIRDPITNRVVEAAVADRLLGALEKLSVRGPPSLSLSPIGTPVRWGAFGRRTTPPPPPPPSLDVSLGDKMLAFMGDDKRLMDIHRRRQESRP
ncbi:MAG: RNase H-like domain-containing protein [Mycobacterium sp.]